MASANDISSTLEVAPRANVTVNNFNFSLAPAYTTYYNFKEKSFTQGINTIFQTTYSISPNTTLAAEVKYVSKPSENLLQTQFENVVNNTSCMLILMHNL